MEKELKRDLTLIDIIFSGYGFTVGVGIYALLPYIIKYGKGYAWLAFLIGGIVALCTGLSYARLNMDYSSNDVEYSWIYESFKDDETEENKNWNFNVKTFASIVIWAVMIFGITMNSTIATGITKFIKPYTNISNNTITFIIISLATIFNFTDTKNVSLINIIVTIFTVSSLMFLPILSIFKHKYISDLTFIPKNYGQLNNIVRAIFLSILPLNGCQSVVQMSEEVKNKEDIPKGIISASILSIITYVLVTLAVIVIIGVSNAASSNSPIKDIYMKFFGNKGDKIVNTIAIMTGFTSLLLSIFSRSRLLAKLSDIGLAPNFFSLNPDKTKENMQNIEDNLPIYSIISVGIASYLLTLIKDDSLELLANLTNTITFFVFICVNLTVIYNHYKKQKTKGKNVEQLNEGELLSKFKNIYPFYALIGIITSLILFVNSFNYY